MYDRGRRCVYVFKYMSAYGCAHVHMCVMCVSERDRKSMHTDTCEQKNCIYTLHYTYAPMSVALQFVAISGH
jgi:hypothetical protein